MLPEYRIPTHPGEILRDQFLEPLGLSTAQFSKHLEVAEERVAGLVKGIRGITPEMAWRLSQAFDTSPEFWINLQAQHDLATSRPKRTIEPLLKAS